MNNIIYSTAEPTLRQKSTAKPALNTFSLESRGRTWNKPPMNVSVGESELRLDIFAAGIDRENIEVRIAQSRLIIEFVKTEHNFENKRLVRREYQSNNCKISFTIAQQYDLNAATTRLINGILHITIPVSEKHVRQIEVQ